MLRYTGHPFVDVGVATITAYANVHDPNQVEPAHIEDFIQRHILEVYLNPAMAGYLSYVIFANARFANPAQIKNSKYDVPRREKLLELLQLWKNQPGDPIPDKEEPPAPGERCVFSGDIAVVRASRMLIPMTGSEDAINFVPKGIPKLPISGWCLLAILAMPLGSINSGGRVFLVHSHDTEMLQVIAAKNLQRNLDAFQMQSLAKRPNYKFPRTLLLNDLVATGKLDKRNASLTIYYFTSSGLNSRIDIYQLSSHILDFIGLAIIQDSSAWNQIVKTAWELEHPVKEKPGIVEYRERNFFYEDIFGLPGNARYFLRRYLLRQKPRGKATGIKKFDPRFDYSFIQEKEVVSWTLIDLFLERVINMDKERLQAIKNLADRLAEYIEKEDSRLYKRLYLARNDYGMRQELIKAANNAKGTYRETLLPYDEFIDVFFIDEGDTAKSDWYLARDLLMIRVIEQISANWIEQNIEMLEEVDTASRKETEDN